MKFGLIRIILFVFVEVASVKSECFTYSGCFQQFYDGFIGSFTNLSAKETQLSDIEVPGFENVNIESDNADSIFKTIAGFLEELVGDFNLNSQFNVFNNIDNKTSILVQTVNIAEDLEDFDNVVIKVENKTDKDDRDHLDGLKRVTSVVQNIELTTKVNVNGITPKTIVNPVLNINELSKRVKENEITDTDSYDYDNSTDYPVIDYIDLYKDTTNDYEEIKTTTVSTYEINENENITKSSYNNLTNVNPDRIFTEECMNATDAANVVFPWVTAIFIKNGTSNQFDYYCDGALLSDTVIITAASCIQEPNATSEDLLVIFGKTSLKVMTENEIIAKIEDVHIHDNFTGMEQNLALLVMKVPLAPSDHVKPARLGDGDDESATTGWAVSGELTLIPLKEEKKYCNHDIPSTFCAVYGNDVTVCPSYGGIYVARQSNDWFLRGIRSDEPINKSFCADRTASYTDLKSYTDWINMYIK